MPLRFDLGPFEELHIGRCMTHKFSRKVAIRCRRRYADFERQGVSAGNGRARPLEKLYRCIQQMYLEEAYDKYQGRYLQLAAECLRNDPKLSAELEAGDQLSGPATSTARSKSSKS